MSHGAVSIIKKWFPVLLWLGMGVSPSPAAWIGVFGSHWDSKDAGKTFGGGVLFRQNLNPNWQWDIRGSLYSFDTQEGDAVIDLEIIPLEATLTMKVIKDPAYMFYAGGGAGYYLVDADITLSGVKERARADDTIGYFILAGLLYRMQYNITLFGELKYIRLELDQPAVRGNPTAPSDDNIIAGEMNMNGLIGNVGLLIRF